MSSPANHRLTEKEEGLFLELHNKKMRHHETFKEYPGLWDNIVDQYKETAHFVYELLQNADDAQATKVYMTIDHNGLVFRHNGKVHFNITEEPKNEEEKNTKRRGHINAICSVGDSTKKAKEKDEKQENKIGKFGVGFKSVFTYTDSPHIYDDKFWFKIENFIIPSLLTEDHPKRNPGETLFYFPFKKEEPTKCFTEISRRIKDLDNPTLFLHHLKEVNWEFVVNGVVKEQGCYKKRTLWSKNFINGIKVKFISSENPIDNKQLFQFIQEVDVEGEKHKISVAYFYHKATKCLDVDGGKKVYCFFPTAETFNTCYISHAPFILTNNRQSIKDNKTNRELVEKLSYLAAKALIFFRDYSIESDIQLLNANIISIIPFDIKPTYYSWMEPEVTQMPIIREAFIETVKKEKLLLSNSGIYISVNDAYICQPKSLLDVLTDQQLTQLTQNIKPKYFLTEPLCGNEHREKIQKLIGNPCYTPEKLAEDITPQFMKKQDLKWVFKFYNFLRHEVAGLVVSSQNSKNKRLPFRFAPIILTSKNTWVPLCTDNSINVYLPNETLSDDYLYVSDKLLNNEDGEKFIKYIGIKEPDRKSYIDSVIIPKYKLIFKYKDGISPTKKQILDHNNDLIYIYSYLQTLGNKEEKRTFIESIKEHILLLDNTYGCGFTSPEDLYIYTKELSRYFKKANIRVRYVGLKEYSTFIEKFSEDNVVSFFSDLGAYNFPAVYEVKANYYAFSASQRAQINSRITEQYGNDFKIEGLEEVLSSHEYSLNDSIKIWKWLQSGEYDEFKECEYHYKYYSWNTTSIHSSFRDLLINSAWLYNSDNKRCKPCEMFWEDFETNGYDDADSLKEFLGLIFISRKEPQKELSKEEIFYNFAKNSGIGSIEELEEKLARLEALEKLEQEKLEEEKRKQEKAQKRKETKSYSKDEESSLSNDFDKYDFTPTRTVSTSTSSNKASTLSEDYEVRQRQLTLEYEEKQELEELRQSLGEKEKYSFDWFTSLLKLEYSSTSENDDDNIRKKLSVEFSNTAYDESTDRVLVLSNPSRYIPLWLEEIDNIEVLFLFNTKEELRLTFDVSSVKGYTLALKAKAKDANIIKNTDWDSCYKARIDINNPMKLADQLRSSFENLGYEPDFNMKDNLTNNIRFIFGPPGTGKTTTLANDIINIVQENSQCKILVLAPTNKACDVLCKKIIDSDDNSIEWVGRFVATSDEEIEEIGAVFDRLSTIYEKDKCCIISTIARLPFDGFKNDFGTKYLKNIDWDYVIFDEASMIPLAQIVYPLYKFNSNFIISGDPFQIEPIVSEPLWEEENIYKMVNLNSFKNPKTEPHDYNVKPLNTQYRSIPAIGRLFSEYSYDGLLKHNRDSQSQVKVKVDGLPLKPINYYFFDVNKYEGCFAVKKLSTSNVHVYSVIYILEYCNYLVKHLEIEEGKTFKIGIICPYTAQAQLIENLINQVIALPINIEIHVGTIHCFQGDQCNMIITVFNPPKKADDNTFKSLINKKNIINVAVSRAEDYLCVFMPHPDTYIFNQLHELKELTCIAQKSPSDLSMKTCNEMETLICGENNYIINNTFVTSHQLANVYTRPEFHYEVRIDEKAADIQINKDWD